MPTHRKLPWYGWLLAPLVLPGVLIVGVPLGLLALVSIPYFILFPERHRHQHDFEGTPRQQERLARWRRRYSRLGVRRRIRRALHNLRHRHPVA